MQASVMACSSGGRLFPLTALILCLAGIDAGCAPTPTTVGIPQGTEAWQVGQVLAVSTGQPVPYDQWLKELQNYDIVYLGEEHYNHHHIDAAMTVLSGLLTAGIRPAIGMEMFGWDGQSALDRYLSESSLGQSEFLEQAHWKANWGGDYENYRPLVDFAKGRRLLVRALNPPKGLIRRVAKLGLSRAREGDDWKQWDMDREDIVDDPAYRARIFDQLRRCHGGGADEDFQTMYEASMVRDEGMAKTLVALLETLRRESPGERRTVVSYTGGGHIQYNLPVPARVARRLSGHVRQVTVYLTAYDPSRTEEIRELLQERIADYIWLTPPGGQGPVQRCR
jgi:uncharacterized iron-regulated protein